MKKSVKALAALACVSAGLTALAAYAAAPEFSAAIRYNGKDIPVSLGEMGKDDTGRATVQILMDFEMTLGDFDPDLALRAVSEAVRVKIVVQSESLEASEFSINSGGLTLSPTADGKISAKISHIIYQFNTTALPEEIIVYNGQGADLRFHGGTKEISNPGKMK